MVTFHLASRFLALLVLTASLLPTQCADGLTGDGISRSGRGGKQQASRHLLDDSGNQQWGGTDEQGESQQGKGRKMQGRMNENGHAYVAACAIFKNENGNVREWVDYHSWLGIGKLYIFDHGSTPPLADELADYVRSGLVELYFFGGNSWQVDEPRYQSPVRQFLSPQGWASDAVWLTLALNFVMEQLESGEAKSTDVMTVIGMNDGSSVLIDRQPLDWLLFNELVRLLRTSHPKQGGKYLPALALASQYLQLNTCGSCALMLFFLSDGRPSDPPPQGTSPTRHKQNVQMSSHMRKLASSYGRRLTVGTIGFSKCGEDFSVMQHMAQVCSEYGGRGAFQSPSLTAASLRIAITSLTSTLTATKTEMTVLGGGPGGGLRQRTVRDICCESMVDAAANDYRADDTWYAYPANRIISHVRWSYEDRDWVPVRMVASAGALGGIAMKKMIFGEGAERMVRKLRELAPDGITLIGPQLVAKEGRYTEDVDHRGLADRRQFHKVFCQTQQTAQRMAVAFNQQLDAIPGATSAPRVRFLDCSVYVVNDTLLGKVGLLVEKMLDIGGYKKWNNNNGYVDGMSGYPQHGGPVAEAVANPLLGLNHLDLIEEEGEESEGDDDSLEAGHADAEEHRDENKHYLADNARSERPIAFTAGDIPQAFTHFTYACTSRKLMVCDLQGVLDTASRPPVFELTDPVIHYKSGRGRTKVFGRSDRGTAGMQQFFKTHECSELCHAVRRTWVRSAHQQGGQIENTENLRVLQATLAGLSLS
eukprot:gene20461-27250_t